MRLIMFNTLMGVAAGVALMLVPRLNFYTHTGMLVNLGDGADFRW